MIHGRNFAARVPGARMAAISDPDARAREAAAAELGVSNAVADYRAVIDDPAVNAVVIVTPTRLHREIALAAAAAGKHILCEKPMAMTAAECDEIIAGADSARVKLQIGFMRRFDPAFCEVKERIDSGEIGDVVLVRSLTHGPSVPQPWMYDLRASNGPLAEVNSHDFDTLRWLTGGEFAEIYAIAGNFRSPQAREEFPDFYDNVSLVARFTNGMQGIITGAQGVGYAYDARCEVLGARGILFAGGLRARAVSSCTADGLRSPAIKSWRDLFAEAYRAEDEDFVRCIREDTAPKVTGFDGRQAVRAVNAGNESIRTGKPVTL